MNWTEEQKKIANRDVYDGPHWNSPAASPVILGGVAVELALQRNLLAEQMQKFVALFEYWRIERPSEHILQEWERKARETLKAVEEVGRDER